ncbi:hypothetical protein EST38_g2642 [Candolleomyces aberdarensis]|uniref:Uncharacterized protein n=1 Tax=Candolleomyces aberdarensis TaxID=2316362 RepID=A0A4Q2DSF8_9AGAR|nr:hypothetical protein EST38_g2642 [Candolleomyces aberdarensis]
MQGMEDRIAAYTEGGGVVNPPAPQAAPSAQPSDHHHRHHHHDAANADTQPFFLSGPLDIARGYGCALCEDAGEVPEGICRCGEELKVKEEPTSEQEDEDEIMRSTGSSAMSGISIPASSSSKTKGKGKQVHPSSGPLESSAQRSNAQAFLPAVSVYYIEQAASTSATVPLGIPVSNPNPPTSFSGSEVAPLFYASNPDHLQPPQPQALATFSTGAGLSVAATPLASPSAASPMGPPPPPVRGHQEVASKPSVTLALIAQLPDTESGLQLLKNAMNALNCFLLDLGLPHMPASREERTLRACILDQ